MSRNVHLFTSVIGRPPESGSGKGLSGEAGRETTRNEGGLPAVSGEALPQPLFDLHEPLEQKPV